MCIPSRILTGMGFLMVLICASAQDQSTEKASEDAVGKVLEHVTVTGYHIKRTDAEGPAPVLIYDAGDLEEAGIATLAEFATFLSINKPVPVQGTPTGIAFFDLRGIGWNTTLVLVNGLRIASYATNAASVIDVNSIPIAAIDRIEILKDGASAIYGADALAGVVNIILRTDFDGMEASASYGISSRGDGEELGIDFVAGRDGSRGSFMFSLSWFDHGNLAHRDRAWSADADYSSIGGPNYRQPWSSPPTFVRFDNGAWEADPACGTDPSFSSVAPSPWGSDYGSACYFNHLQYKDRDRAWERLGFSFSGRYSVNPDLSLFGDVFVNKVEGKNNLGLTPAMASALYQSWTGGHYVPAGHPGNPFGTDGELHSRLLDIGQPLALNKSTAYRATFGLEGRQNHWNWRLTGLASKNKVERTYLNEVYSSRYQLALLGMGGPDGGQWYNPFGFAPRNDPELVDWLRADAHSSDSSGARSIDFVASREFGKLPGGPAGLAAGLQYREQDLDQWADANLVSGELGFYLEPVAAGRDIGSAYLELKLPLLNNLEAQLAVRYEDYSDFGSTTNPKLALRWRPTTSLMFRGSWSTSFVPPAFYELYLPDNNWWWSYIDTERCEVTGLPADCTSRPYPVEGGGNPDLEPEDGESWFAGLLWEPEGLPGFGIQLDFWKFRHEGRIDWLFSQAVLDAGGGPGIIREPTEPDGTPGRIIRIREAFFNTDELLTRGFDTTLHYRWQSERAGEFQATLMHTYVDKWVFVESLAGNEFLNRNIAGHWWGVAVPRNRADLSLFWNRARHGASANVHHVGHYYNNEYLWVDGEQTDQFMTISGHTTVDLQYSYTFKRFKNAALRIGCTNCSDKDPPMVYRPVNEPFHDGRGRYYYVRWQQPIGR